MLAASAAAVAGLAAVLSTGVQGQLTARHDGGWDRLQLQADFTEHSWLHRRMLTESGPTTVEVDGADGTRLYRGSSDRVSVDDAALGHQEPMALRVCRTLTPWYGGSARRHCASTTLAASPKRYVPLSRVVVYPRGGPAWQPAIGFQHELQRATFGQAEQWHRLRVLDGPVRLRVWVANAPERAVDLALKPSRTIQPVDLREGNGYAAFQGAVQQAQAAGPAVALQFRFHTGPGAESTAYPDQAVTLHGKSADERRGELQSLADRAARLLVGRHYGGGRDIRAELLSAQHDTDTRRYQAQAAHPLARPRAGRQHLLGAGPAEHRRAGRAQPLRGVHRGRLPAAGAGLGRHHPEARRRGAGRGGALSHRAARPGTAPSQRTGRGVPPAAPQGSVDSPHLQSSPHHTARSAP